MAELHGFVTPTNLIIEFDEEDIVPRQKPKYARQLAMVDEPESCMPDPVKPDPPVENESKEDSYDITVTVTTSSRVYEKYRWNKDRIQIRGIVHQICKDVNRVVGTCSYWDIFVR